MSTYLFVDGTNLYAAQYELFGPNKYICFSELIKQTEQKLQLSFTKIYFYASYSPKSKKPHQNEKLFLKNEGLFYRSVKQTDKVVFFTGYRSKTSGKEKEVDVKLTADIITYAFLKRFNNVFLLTGDADFLQALLSIRKFHNRININLLCMENKIMYQGLFRFKTFIMVFIRKPVFKRIFKTVQTISLSSNKTVLKL